MSYTTLESDQPNLIEQGFPIRIQHRELNFARDTWLSDVYGLT